MLIDVNSMRANRRDKSGLCMMYCEVLNPPGVGRNRLSS